MLLFVSMKALKSKLILIHVSCFGQLVKEGTAVA